MPGKVVRINPAPEIALAKRAGRQTDTLLTMGGVLSSNRDSLPPISVFLPDGKTPAWGAQVAVFTPKIWSAILRGKADALGSVSRMDGCYSYDAPSTPPPGSPTEPVMVAWLPGASGAAIVPLPLANRSIILPVPASIRGHLTVDQKPVRELNSSFTVLAAYQGKGKLNSALSVEATADANGDFELAGLTPGDYVVQAARDGIWLSSSQRLTVGSQPLPEMDFDIPAPGTPMLLHFQNSTGEALVEKRVSFMRPAGPLADMLWPQSVRTNANGSLYLNGLEAGIHIFQVESTNLNAKRKTQTGSSGKSKDSPPFKTTFTVAVKALVIGSSSEQKSFVVALP
ncbi:hypothetical protein B1R32_1461 [Abditibacterium utsteinense]|uniref:Carboxypeptidase regulatory-like domain-containing protein n=1 Tax=Abditibacterium utsteinense TaxID=1960156 RepID=A0A2S8SNH2_9BACT|nr:carboxypeptidase-like regulatory domain-containing protein [Abditibacterium utsteinense]PQV62380.1 hypothetical protein B1R32_1461 [Abditibacterium utsteinense]